MIINSCDQYTKQIQVIDKNRKDKKIMDITTNTNDISNPVNKPSFIHRTKLKIGKLVSNATLWLLEQRMRVLTVILNYVKAGGQFQVKTK